MEDELVSPTRGITVFSAPNLPGQTQGMNGELDLLLGRLYDNHSLRDVVNMPERMPAVRQAS